MKLNSRIKRYTHFLFGFLIESIKPPYIFNAYRTGTLIPIIADKMYHHILKRVFEKVHILCQLLKQIIIICMSLDVSVKIDCRINIKFTILE